MDLNYVRNFFPSLDKHFIFMDNAGGTQTAQPVIDNISYYYQHLNVQLGASYKISARATEELGMVSVGLAQFMGADDPREVVIGSSSTMLLRILSICLGRTWSKGDEIIITNSDHEANVSPWTDLERAGIKIKTWKINQETLEFALEDLKKLLTDKTRLLAMGHVSNILGTLNPVKQAAEIIHEAGALICIDGVACAPHRPIDVQQLDADFYVFSPYKVFGPHLGILYGKLDILKDLDGINHYFFGRDSIPQKLQPGGVNYELTYGLEGVLQYFKSLYQHHYSEPDTPDVRETLKIYYLIADHEERLLKTLLMYLISKKNIRIIGSESWDRAKRVCTVSFVHDKMKSSEIAGKMDEHNIGIRFGDFYAKKLIKDLGLIEKDGVVRVSLVHYNSEQEVDALIEAFDTIL